MDRKERLPDAQEVLRVVQGSLAERLWCGGPGIIEYVDLVKMTCNVQPAIEWFKKNQSGEYEPITLPLLLDCPIMFAQGGGLALTFPVAAGDECYFHIADRCIDNWWASGGVQLPAELRMHDLSDGFAFVGINSQPHRIPNISTTSAQFRNLAGTAYMEITQAGVLNYVAPAGVNITGPLTVTGATTITGAVKTTGTLDNNNVNVGSGHEHTGVQTGSGTSGPPVNTP